MLLQLRPADTFKGGARGTILVTAQDMFFTPFPATNALELVNYSKDHLQADYKVELPPTRTTVGGQAFTFFAYWSPIAETHWYVLATEIRCHAVQIILTSRDTKLLESLIADMNKMKLPEEASPTAGTGGGAFPVCVKDYATDENLITRVDPSFHRTQIQRGSSANHHRSRRQGQAYSLSKRVSRSGKSHHGCAKSVEIQALRARRKAGRG